MCPTPRHKKPEYDRVCKWCKKSFVAKMVHTEYCYSELCIYDRKRVRNAQRYQERISNDPTTHKKQTEFQRRCQHCKAEFTSKMSNTKYCYAPKCTREVAELRKKRLRESRRKKKEKLGLLLIFIVFCSVYAPGKYYNQHNQYIGKQTIQGKCYDKSGAYRGRVTKDGKRYDRSGKYLGRHVK